MLLDFLEPGLRFSSHLSNPCSGSVPQLRMIFVFPCPFGGEQRFKLLTTLDFVAGYFRQERTSASLSDEFVDVGYHVNGKCHMRSSVQILGHTHSVTEIGLVGCGPIVSRPYVSLQGY